MTVGSAGHEQAIGNVELGLDNLPSVSRVEPCPPVSTVSRLRPSTRRLVDERQQFLVRIRLSRGPSPSLDSHRQGSAAKALARTGIETRHDDSTSPAFGIRSLDLWPPPSASYAQHMATARSAGMDTERAKSREPRAVGMARTVGRTSADQGCSADPERVPEPRQAREALREQQSTRKHERRPEPDAVPNGPEDGWCGREKAIRRRMARARWGLDNRLPVSMAPVFHVSKRMPVVARSTSKFCCRTRAIRRIEAG